MKDLTLLEAGRWMDAAPQIIQDAITSPATGQTIEQLGKQYTLHIDAIGLLEKLTSYMLLGYTRPEESLQELRAAGISEQQARQILDDINKKIFVPLRDRMRSGVVSTTLPTKPATPEVRPELHPSEAFGGGGLTISKVEPRTQTPPRFFHLENKLPSPAPIKTQQPTIPVPVRPIMQPAVVATPSTLAQAIGNALNTKPNVMPQSQPMPPRPPVSNIAPLPPKFISPRYAAFSGNQVSTNQKMLEDHEEPHIEFSKAPMQPRPAQLPKVEPQIPPRSVMPFSTPVPPNLPGAMPPFPVPDVQSAPEVKEVHTLPVQPLVQPRPTSPIIPPPPKSYTVDPYREPIDEPLLK